MNGLLKMWFISPAVSLSLNKHLNERMDAQLEIECVCAVEFSSLSIRWQHSDKIKG